jgi:ketosteroid isomerase-like protein
MEEAMTATSDTIKALYHEWTTAMVEKNLPVVERIVAPEFRYTDNIQGHKRRDARFEALIAYEMRSFTFTKVEVAEYDDLVIAFVEYTQEAMLRGVPRSGDWLITDAWRRGTVGWQLVARSAILKANTPDDTAKQELDARIVEFGEAWARGDAERLRGMLSPGYTHTDVWGEILDRDAWLAYARGRSGMQAQITFADVIMRFAGNVAIVIGRNDVSGQVGLSRPGPASPRIRFTQVWVRSDGRWLREAFQATLVKD